MKKIVTSIIICFSLMLGTVALCYAGTTTYSVSHTLSVKSYVATAKVTCTPKATIKIHMQMCNLPSSSSSTSASLKLSAVDGSTTDTSYTLKGYPYSGFYLSWVTSSGYVGGEAIKTITEYS